MLGLVFGTLLRVVPWITAPEFSLCYFLFFLAFAVDFSLLTLVFPTSLACYALIASPKPGPNFWLVMLAGGGASLTPLLSPHFSRSIHASNSGKVALADT
jgi:hypothetical protein